MTFFLAILAVLVLIALYAATAYYLYNRVPPQSRPCVDCGTPAHVNGYDLYYRELGTDKGLPPIILVHGGPGHSSLSFKDGFDFLAEETRVIFYDQRGSGNSQIKPNPKDYTIEQLVEELESLRRDIVKADKIILVSHSFGSALVQRYALKYPKHVEKMVIVGGIRINNGMSSRFIWEWFGGALYSTSLGLPPADSKAADEWFTKSSEKDNPNRLFDKTNTAILEDTGTVSFAPWREISFSLTGYDYKKELSKLQVPTLFIYGTADSPYTGKPVADELCATLPNCQSVEFTQSGHWAFLEEPEKFQQVIRGFLIPNSAFCILHSKMTFPSTSPLRSPSYKGSTEQTLYIPMRDGTHLAVDLYLPRGLAPETKIPALFAATRYWRAQQLKAPFSWFLSLPDSARNFFTAFGYAVLRIDMRGTGASEGNHPHPWSATDLTDLYDLTEWVTQQPWSNGQIGGFGNSYQATTAEMLGAYGHPAVTTALVRFNEYDVYTDIAFPGGVPNEFMLTHWADYNRALDANQLPKSMSMLEKILVKGVKPVGGNPIPKHNNQQVDSALRHITFRDDLDPELNIRMDDISMFNRPTNHAIDHWGSWFDAATANAVIYRFANNPRPQRAVIGAWNHGAIQHIGAKENPFPLLAQMKESLRFFDNPPTTSELHYFTIFENEWKSTPEFPPAGLTSTRFFFQPQSGLSSLLPPPTPADHYQTDFNASTGLNNRWQTELDQRPVKYAPIKGQLSYTSAPLEQDIEITGYPIVTLFVKSTHDDGNFFVYLEAIDEQGNTHYLTEGMLRAIHRKVSTDTPPYKQLVPYHSFKRADAMPLIPNEVAEITFGLNPISALIRRGWKVRVSISGADKDTFARIPLTGSPSVEIMIGGDQASFIEIPIK